MAADEVDRHAAPLARPSWSAGWMSGSNERSRSMASQSSSDQSSVRTSSRPVVPALVGSPVTTPVRWCTTQLREHQEVSGARELFAVVGGELEDRVEGQVLETIDLVQPASADVLDHLLVRVGAIVAIGQRCLEELAATIQEAVVHAPGGDADRGDRAGVRRERESALHLGHEQRTSPTAGAASRPRRGACATRWRTSRRGGPSPISTRHTRIGCRAEVDGRDRGGHVTARWRRSPRRARRPSPGGNRRAGRS